MLTSENLRLISLKRTGGGHYKAMIQAADGRTLLYVLGSTTSDNRAAKNRKRDIVRFFNN